jgi:hypothetical protein
MEPRAEQMRDQLVSLAVNAWVAMAPYSRNDPRLEVQKLISREYGRYESARASLILFLESFGQVASFQSANVADWIIDNAIRNR